MKELITSTPAEGSGSGTTLYEGLSVELVPAPVLKRYLAFAIDTGIISAVLYVAFLGLMVLGALLLGAGFALKGPINAIREQVQGLETAGLIVLILIGFLLLLALFVLFDGYFIWFEYKKGTTPGKKIFGMRVVSLRGPRLTLGQCLVREALRIVDVGLLFPGVIAIAATEKRQRLGDLVGGVMVVYSERKEKNDDHLYLTHDKYLSLVVRFAPKVPTPEACREFLSFAYGELVLQRGQASPMVLETWDGFALRHVPAMESLDRQTRLLFFAELCFQVMNGNPPKVLEGV